MLPLVAGGGLMMRLGVLVAGAVFAFASVAFAQTADVVAAPETLAPPATSATSIRIPAGTIVQVELTEPLSSETSMQTQLFGLRLVEPIVIDGREIVPAGAIGGGEVIDAHPSAFGGRQGRLIISGRFIEIGGQRARIRAMQVTAAGQDRSDTAIVVGALVGAPAFLIQGGEVQMPAGTRAVARLAADVDVPLETPASVDAGVQPSNGENQQ